MTVSLPLLAADPLPWPWKSKTPPDPALVELSQRRRRHGHHRQVEPIVTITVKAHAPSPDYTELQLTPRVGDPNDRIFAFDARGRAPQDIGAQACSRR